MTTSWGKHTNQQRINPSWRRWVVVEVVVAMVVVVVVVLVVVVAIL